MQSELIINSNENETRVVLFENNTVAELFIERKNEAGIAGNVYKGKIIKVLPGMQAAFVDIGLEKAGFLYISDVDIMDIMDKHEKLFMKDYDTSDEEFDFKKDRARKGGQKISLPIEDILQKDQEILVQVAKNPIGTKGARLTSYITLPGRYLVFMPAIDQVAISRRIENEAEKRKLKKIINQIKTPGMGYIVRTVGEGKEKSEFTADSIFLNKLWRDIKKKGEQVSAPALIYKDIDLVKRCLRDLDVNKVLIDSNEEYEKCIDFVKSYLSPQNYKIELYTGKEPLFEAFGLEMEINRALGRKIWLKSGGYIIIDHTEALIAIDVNTGRYVGKKNQEHTIVKTNLEAVKEIVYQLRLRNIGGLIIIDFIDMERKENKEKVYKALEHALKQDRSRTTILKVSELGIVEMTRKRISESLNKVLCQSCPYCEGRGEIKSAATICYEIFREIQKFAKHIPNKKKKICVNAHHDVANMLFNEETHYLSKIENELDKTIIIKTDKNLHIEQYEVSAE